ncbi:hypothetical protein BH23ACT5_BH23ACT5_19400 [soil metagenome]
MPLPIAALVHQIVVDGIGQGFGDLDFAALLTKLSKGTGREIESEERDDVTDGLS